MKRPPFEEFEIKETGRFCIVAKTEVTEILKKTDLLAAGFVKVPMPSNAGFGLLVKLYRTALDLSREELGKKVGLSGRALSDIENGETQNPQTETLSEMIRLFGEVFKEQAQVLLDSSED